MLREGHTSVISVFPACGKTYAFNHYQDFTNFNNVKYYSILDSDSSLFSWVYDKDGNKTNDRNPEFPNNYIQHIQDNIGKYDFIFVSTHTDVRKAMSDAGIRFCCVYPKENLLNEFVGRMYRRGNSPKFIQSIIDHWDEYMEEAHLMKYTGFGVWRLGAGQYLDRITLDTLYGW